MRRRPPTREPREPRPDPRPGRITRIAPQAHDPDRVSVFIDGEFAFGLPALVAAAERLAPGVDLDDTRLASLLAQDETARATTASLAFLAYRPRSEREVRDRLRQKGYGPEAVEGAIAKLREWRYLDDADFARRWVENRAIHRPAGGRLIAQELQRKGVDRETVREALAEAEIDERAAALEVARERARRLAGEDPATARRRLAAYLARRGFGYDAVRPALDAVLGESPDEDDPGEA